MTAISSNVRGARLGGGAGVLRPETEWLAGYRPVGPAHAWYGGVLLATAAVRDSDGAAVTVHAVAADLDRASIRRIRTEAAELEAALAEQPNPYVVPLLDHGRTPDGRPLLVTGAYGQHVAGPLPVEEVRRVAAAAGSGLELLHRARLLHRGLAPQAVLRYPDGRVLLSCPLPAAVAELVGDTPAGTGHEPPEVLSGGDWSPAGEVYALASTLWTLLAGQPPMAGGREERLVRLLGGGAPTLRRSDVPAYVISALRRGLAAGVDERPVSAAALVGAVVAEVEPEVETAAPSRPLEQPLGRRYVKEALLGRGSAGEVWRVRRRDDGAHFAAKLLHAQLAGDADAVHRLLTEQRLLARLRHPNLVRVHEVVADEDVAIVMDLVPGPNLRQLVGHLDRGEALRLLAQVAAALAVIHEAGVLHRDLKPANVLVAGDAGSRTALLTDLGIAKVLDEPTMTQTGYVLGTYAYLAPEVIAGNEPLRPAADVYALGITAYEVLTGARPFRGDVTELLEAHLRQQPPRPPDLPEPLWQLLAACLDKRSDHRPTAADAAAALAAFAGMQPPAAGPASAAGPAATPPLAAPQDSVAPQVMPWATTDVPPPTAAGRQLPPLPAGPGPRKRSRWPLVAAATTVVLAGSSLGVWLALPDHSPATPRPGSTQSSSAENLTGYEVQATATSDATGAVTLSWPASSAKLTGFQGYVVVRDTSDVLTPAPIRTASYRDDSTDNHCHTYRVIAYGVPGTHPATPATNCRPTSGNSS